MKFVSFRQAGRIGLGVETPTGLRGVLEGDASHPVRLAELVGQGGEALAAAGRTLAEARAFDPDEIEHLPPFAEPGKIVCLGLNYTDHAAEGGFAPPPYPALFSRFASSLVGHGAPLVRPVVSEQFDYEGELVAVIGRPGRHIAPADALSHVAGYSIFNDGSVRDYQFKSPQWTIGKNFDGTGAFGPCFVTPDALPDGASGLALRTRLNGTVVQEANTADMIFGVATTISLLSECFVLQTGDVIVMGTPAGIGFARSPKLFMKPGDICEVEIEGIGTLSNPVVDETA